MINTCLLLFPLHLEKLKRTPSLHKHINKFQSDVSEAKKLTIKKKAEGTRDKQVQEESAACKDQIQAAGEDHSQLDSRNVPEDTEVYDEAQQAKKPRTSFTEKSRSLPCTSTQEVSSSNMTNLISGPDNTKQISDLVDCAQLENKIPSISVDVMCHGIVSLQSDGECAEHNVESLNEARDCLSQKEAGELEAPSQHKDGDEDMHQNGSSENTHSLPLDGSENDPDGMLNSPDDSTGGAFCGQASELQSPPSLVGDEWNLVPKAKEPELMKQDVNAQSEASEGLYPICLCS